MILEVGEGIGRDSVGFSPATGQLRHPVRRPTGVDFLLAPPGGPTDLAVAYPVVRFAGEAPVPDGRVQGDGLAVKNKFSSRWD